MALTWQPPLNVKFIYRINTTCWGNIQFFKKKLLWGEGDGPGNLLRGTWPIKDPTRGHWRPCAMHVASKRTLGHTTQCSDRYSHNPALPLSAGHPSNMTSDRLLRRALPSRGRSCHGPALTHLGRSPCTASPQLVFSSHVNNGVEIHKIIKMKVFSLPYDTWNLLSKELFVLQNAIRDN